MGHPAREAPLPGENGIGMQGVPVPAQPGEIVKGACRDGGRALRTMTYGDILEAQRFRDGRSHNGWGDRKHPVPTPSISIDAPTANPYNRPLVTQVKTVVACAACGEAGTHLVQQGVRNRKDLDVLRCSGCGLQRLSVLPTEEELQAYYAHSYREEHEPGLPPEGAYRNELPEARARAARLSPLLDAGTDLLELGASSGAFVDSVRPFVRSATGIEPSKRHREWAKDDKGLDMLPSLEAAGNRRFGLIALFHVLEHIRHPEPFLRGLIGRLGQGGRLVIEVPNADDALLSVFKVPNFAPHYYQDAHLWYFNADTLTRLLRGAGLSADIRWVQRYDLSNHLHWLGAGAPGGKGRYADLLGPAADAAYAEALCRGHVSDTLWAVARPAANASETSPQENSR